MCRQVYEPGQEAEVDWGEATVEVDWGEATVEVAGQRLEVGLFLLRACYSGASFVLAFERQTQQAFLEAHVEAFRFFGGTFALVRYDNLRAAVKQVLRGRRRLEQDRFVALRSHYRYESAFTRTGRAGAREKGGVEGESGAQSSKPRSILASKYQAGNSAMRPFRNITEFVNIQLPTALCSRVVIFCGIRPEMR
jgi:transposase